MSKDPLQTPKQVSNLIAQTCGAIAAAIGFCALAGLTLDLPQLASLGPGWIPMPPSTALLLMLLGTAVFFVGSAPQSRSAYRAGVLVGAAGALAALALLILSYQGTYLDLEHFGLAISGTVGGAQVGHMSPVSAACFLAGGLSLIALVAASAERPALARVGVGFACLLVLTNFIFLLAYLFGTPLLYGGLFIPPALTTCVALTVLGAALLAVAASRAWTPGHRTDTEARRASRSLLIIFALLAVSLVGAGAVLFRSLAAQHRAAAERELSAIADLKVNELVNWRAELLGDATLLQRNPVFADLVRRALGNARDAKARRQLDVWLAQYQVAYGYRSVSLIDRQGVARIAIPHGSPAASGLAGARQALASGTIRLEDFRYDVNGDAPVLSLLVPIVEAADGGRPEGVLMLEIDPDTYLYPSIERWPTLSRTAETLLVRRDGDDVLVLNNLRYERNTALSLRYPLTRTELPAVRAALGEEGVAEGSGDHGEAVIAAMRTVPGTPWFLITRIATNEFLESIEETLFFTAGLVGTLLLSAGAALGLVWRQQRVRHYRERTRTAEAIASGAVRYRALTQTAADAIVTTDGAGMINGWNAAAERIFGYAEAEALGQPFTRLMPARYHADHLAWIDKVRAGAAQGTSRASFELHGLTTTGKEFPLELSLSAWETAEGRFFTAIMREITARKLAEVELRKLSRAVEQSPISIVITDRSGNIEYVNPRFEEITGYTHEEVLGGNSRILQSGKTSPDTYTEMWRAISGGGEWRGEICNRRKDGELFWEHIAISGLKDETGQVVHYIGVKENITKLKQNEDDLRQAMNAAEQASRAKSTFLASMSHEIRTPLHNIIGLAQLSRRDATDPKQRKRLDDICSSSEHLLSVITNVLDLSKIEADRLVLEHRDFSLGRVLNRLMSVVAASARKKDVNLVLDVPLSLHGTPLRGDALRLGQVLINLVANSIKFSERGSVTVSVSCLNEDTAGLRLKFSVRDTGIGIAPGDRARLFAAFEQADKSINRKFGGTGLGLTISDRLVRAMGGAINVESEPGAGSTFSFEILLPRGNPPDEDDDEDEFTEATPSVKFGDSHVLVAEDHPLSRELMREMLSEFGCALDFATDGGEAVECARKHAYDLILMDMQMPVLDGLAAARAIRQLPGHERTPILALTANAFVEDREQCLQAGMNGHLSKPLTPAALAHVLGHWLAESSPSNADAADNAGSNEASGPAAGLDSSAMLGGAIGHGLTREFILSEFLRLHRDDLAQLRAHLAAGDTDSARKQVHTLEGAAAMVGARTLRSALGGLGAALRAGKDKAAVDAALAACESEISVFLKKWERRASVKAGSAEASTVS